MTEDDFNHELSEEDKEANIEEEVAKAVEATLHKMKVDRLVREAVEEEQINQLLKGVPRHNRRTVRRVLDELARTNDLDYLWDQGMTRSQVLKADPPDFLIADAIPFTDYTTIYGAPGLLKTHLCSSLSLAVNMGAKWMDFYQAKKGVSAYFSGENTTQFQPQVQAQLDVLQQGNETLNGACPGRWWEAALDLTDRVTLVAVVLNIERLREGAKVANGVCIFDPDGLFRGTDGGGEVESTEAIAKSLRALARGMPHWAFIAVGHTEATNKRHRGTDHIKQFAGAHIKVDPWSSDEVVMVWEKIRGRQQPAIWVEKAAVGEGIFLRNARERVFRDTDYYRELADKKPGARSGTGSVGVGVGVGVGASSRPTGSAAAANLAEQVRRVVEVAPVAGAGWSGNDFVAELGSRALTLKAVKELATREPGDEVERLVRTEAGKYVATYGQG